MALNDIVVFYVNMDLNVKLNGLSAAYCNFIIVHVSNDIGVGSLIWAAVAGVEVYEVVMVSVGS